MSILARHMDSSSVGNYELEDKLGDGYERRILD